MLDAIRALDVLTARAGRGSGAASASPANRAAATRPTGSPPSIRASMLAVPVSAVTTFDYWIRTDVNWDWHQRPPGVRRIADIGTLLALHAPHPLLVISSRRGTDDQEFPLHEAEKSFQWAKHVYGLLSAEDAAAHYESTTAHGYQEDKREQLYRAVERWLRPPLRQGRQGIAREGGEGRRPALRPAGEQPHRPGDLRRVAETAAAGETSLSDPGALRAFCGSASAGPNRCPRSRPRGWAEEENGPWSAEFWIFEPEPGIRLPAVRIGGKGATGPITLIPGRDKAGRGARPGSWPPGTGIRPARHGRDRRRPGKHAQLGLVRRPSRCRAKQALDLVSGRAILPRNSVRAIRFGGRRQPPRLARSSGGSGGAGIRSLRVAFGLRLSACATR